MQKSEVIEKFQKLLKLKYQSKDTRRTYLSYAKKFVYDSHPTDISNLSDEYLTSYLLSVLGDDHAHISAFNHSVSVLKLIYNVVLDKKQKLSKVKTIKQSPKLKNLPEYNKVVEKIQSVKNIKHKCILATLLTTGLRMSELLNIRLCDINRDTMLILIRNGKGGRTEFVILTKSLLSLIEDYYRMYKPRVFLFQGQSGEEYSSNSVNKIVKKCIGEEYSAHWLRAVAITHLINKKEPLHRTKLFSRHLSDSSVSWYYHYDKSVMDEIRELMEEAV